MVKIVFDTNSCRSESVKHDVFLGYRKDLEKLTEHSEIILPRIVVDEIISQKKRALRKSRDQFLTNPYLKITNADESEIKRLDIDKVVNNLVDDESIKFTVLELSDPKKALEKIYKWAMNKSLPFASDDKAGDKGFKDAYIACVIDELLDACDDEYIVLFTKDGLLGEKYRKHPRVKIVSEFGQAKEYIQEAFVDEYLFEKIKAELEMDDGRLIESWLNAQENWVIRIKNDDENMLVIVDSKAREVLDSMSDTGIASLVDGLINSGGFQDTHNFISVLDGYTDYFSVKQMVQIIKACTENNQIYWIAGDDDIRGFILPIFEYMKDFVDSYTVDKFREYFEVV